MYRSYNVVVNTAAGRRRYMQYLIPFVVASDVVDRYDIWVNTHNGADIEFFRQVATKYPKINLVWQPDGIVDGNRTINAFYKACIEENTIYFKLDDDIVWMEPDAIKNMVKFRINNPEYFLVSPLVINNALSTYLMQIHERISLDKYYNSAANHPILWESGKFATQLHQWFLNTKLRTNDYQYLHLGKVPMGMTRFSINSILWFGDEMRKFNGIVPGDDEEFLSCIYPTKHGMSNCWNGDVIMAHFAFYTQREMLDKANILAQYGNYLAEEWNKEEKMKSIHLNIQEILADIDKRCDKLMSAPSPYRKAGKSKKGVMRKIYLSMPTFIRYIVKHIYAKSRPMPPFINS